MTAVAPTWVVFAAGVEVGACFGMFVASLLSAAAVRRRHR